MRGLKYKHLCLSRSTIEDIEQPGGSSPHWMPGLVAAGCSSCLECVTLCPTGAITMRKSGQITFSYNACIACRACMDTCPSGVIGPMPTVYGASSKERLKRTFTIGNQAHDTGAEAPSQHAQNADKIRIFAKSMHVREVDCGSCNACELEIAATGNPVYDAERFGIHIVASPRHADVLFVTGPVTRQMELALRKTDAATPAPKLIVAVGSCACSGGLFGNTPMTRAGVDTIVDVDLYIPGCPPSPLEILKSIVSLRKIILPR